MESGIVEHLMLEVEGITEDAAVSLLVAKQFNLENALAFASPKYVDDRTTPVVESIDNWQVFQIQLPSFAYRVAVPNTITAGQLRTQLFNWFGMMVEITSVANFQVFGLPVEEDAESLCVLCHMDLDSPVHHLNVADRGSASGTESGSGPFSNANNVRHHHHSHAASASDSSKADVASSASNSNHVVASSGPAANAIEVVSSDGDDDFEDALEYGDDEMDNAGYYENADPGQAAGGAIIGGSCRDEQEGTSSMLMQFPARYGEVHPCFYVGTLASAIRTCYDCRVEERRLLGIYIHNDNSISANIFCSQVMCSDVIVQTLKENCIVWPWDCTTPEQKFFLRTVIGRTLNDTAASAFSSLDDDQFPVLCLLTQTAFSISSLEVAAVISGSSTLDEAVSSLTTSIEAYTVVKSDLLHEQARLDETRRIVDQQRAEYEEAVRKDRAEADRKEREVEEKRKEERREVEQREKHEKHISTLKQELPEEPPADMPSVYSFSFRLPQGQRVHRRFSPEERFQTLLNYIASLGHEGSTIFVFPRRDITDSDPTASISDLGLNQREVLTLD